MAENKKEQNIKAIDINFIKKTADKLLKLMGTDAKAKVLVDEENDAVLVRIETEDEAGLLIGNRGVTLNSIQLALGMIYQRQVGEWQRVLVDIADWREKEKDRLIALAKQASERAKSTGEPQNLYNLSSSQRRIIHLFLSDDEGVKTESAGEGTSRYLIITPKRLF